jgi:radical SAM superfamily enzyme YgiQ (UPF0313 family)
MGHIVLVYPKTGLDLGQIQLPLSFLSIASTVVPDHSVTIIDQRTAPAWEAQLAAELDRNPLCVGITTLTGTQIYYALKTAQFIRARSPQTPIVWGGMHVTTTDDQVIRHPLCDYAVKGEGELAFRELVHALDGKLAVEDVSSLYWKTPSGEVVFNGPGEEIDLNRLPSLPYDLVNIDDYVTPTVSLYDGSRRTLPFEGSRGCPFLCTYCSEPALTKSYRMMKPSLFVERCMAMVSRYGIDHIVFVDDEFFVNKTWATNVAKLIDGRFTWWCQTRANDLLRVDLKLMERCGMKIIAPGLESGSDRILKSVKKSERVEHYTAANRLLAETAITPQYNFMMGFPEEEFEDLYKTVDLILQLKRDNPNAVVNQISVLTPLPGTESYAEAVAKYGFHEPKSLEEWIGVNRHAVVTPWVAAKPRMAETLEYLMYSSYFINTTKRIAKQFWWIPAFLFDLYSKLVLWRWNRHRFSVTWDIAALRFIHKHFINPAQREGYRDLSDIPKTPPHTIARMPSQRPRRVRIVSDDSVPHLIHPEQIQVGSD